MKNNQNKILIVIIIILALALVTLGGYMIYQKQNNTTNDTPSQEENNNKEQDNKEQENLFSLNEALEILNTVGNRTKVYQTLAMRTTMVNDMNDLQNIEKINLGLKENIYQQPTTKIEVETKLKQLFGSNISVQHQDVPCFENENPPHILYNVQTETYSWNENGLGHGGEVLPFL